MRVRSDAPSVDITLVRRWKGQRFPVILPVIACICYCHSGFPFAVRTYGLDRRISEITRIVGIAREGESVPGCWVVIRKPKAQP